MRILLAGLVLMVGSVGMAQDAAVPAAATQTSPEQHRVTPPKPLHMEEPNFSEIARKQKLGGDVMVVFTVDTNGMPQNVRVTRSLADKVPPKQRDAALSLDAKAIEAVKKYRFKPAMKDGVPVAAELHVSVNFQIF